MKIDKEPKKERLAKRCELTNLREEQADQRGVIVTIHISKQRQHLRNETSMVTSV